MTKLKKGKLLVDVINLLENYLMSVCHPKNNWLKQLHIQI
jgi:hypothetical protein